AVVTFGSRAASSTASPPTRSRDGDRGFTARFGHDEIPRDKPASPRSLAAARAHLRLSFAMDLVDASGSFVRTPPLDSDSTISPAYRNHSDTAFQWVGVFGDNPASPVRAQESRHEPESVWRASSTRRHHWRRIRRSFRGPSIARCAL